jgi:6-phosphofructokinase 1
VQRGGVPSAFDRVLATRLGAAAVTELLEGHHGILVGVHGNEMAATPLAEVVGRRKPLDVHLLALAHVLAR